MVVGSRIGAVSFFILCGSATACGGSGSDGGGGAASGAPSSAEGGGGGLTEAGGSNPASGSGGATPAKAKGITVTPKTGQVPLGGKLQFSAVVQGLSSTAVTWSMKEGASAGTISADGLYSAPGTSSTYHVTATSTVDPAFSDTAAVTVSAPAGTRPVLTPGIWANISPPVTLTGPNSGGLLAVAIDPSDPLTLYAGVDVLTAGGRDSEGLWKTTDGGSSWKRLGTGPDPDPYDGTTAYLDLPFNIAVDPADPKHLYVTEGVRGANNGFWVSTDGGVAWTRPKGFTDVSPTNDVTVMAIDPTDFKHVLVGSHDFNNVGVLESKDAGNTWLRHPAPMGWPSGSYGLSFLYEPDLGIGDANTWLVHHEGFWRTKDAGANWAKVSDIQSVHGYTEAIFTSKGVLYSGAAGSLARSDDNGLTWTATKQGVPNSVYYTVGSDGDTLYTAPDYQNDMVSQTITSAEADGLTWSAFAGGSFGRGPQQLRFDSANRIMYAACWTAGLWALKVPPAKTK